MGVRLSGGEHKMSPIEVLSLIVGGLAIVIVVMAFQIWGMRDDARDTRRLVAELIEHEVVQAQMLCDAGVSEAEGCEEDGG